jgi:hypothetical protein
MEIRNMQRTTEQAPRYPFIAAWLIATIFFGWQFVQAKYPLDPKLNGTSIVIMLLCTVTLLVLIRNPIRVGLSENPTQKGPFVLLVLISTGILFLIPILMDRLAFFRLLFFALPVIAVIALILLRQSLEKREFLYAIALALLVGVTGQGPGRIPFASPVLWSILQVFLVPTSLLAGWSILRYTGLRQEDVGRSRFLSDGVAAAFKAFISGIIIAVPWAFMNVFMAGSNLEAWALRDGWIKAWWQPVLALQPGISEEAWGRLFLVPLFFLIFRRVSQPRAAFTAALYVVGYWFAFLHTSGGWGGIQNAVMLGTLYGLPLSYLCLYRDLETAIGFHFWVDFIRFAFAFVLFNR